VGTALLWLALRMRKWRKACSHWAGRIGCDRLSILRLLARDAGFDLRRDTDDSQWQIPFTYRRLPVLSLHALEFEFPHRPPDRVHYVGPMVLESRIDRPMTEEDRDRLDAIFERHRRTPGERKLIYAGFGSVFSTDLAFLQRLIGIVAERPHWDLVISLSDRIPPADLGRLPERVYAFSWIPQLSVLRVADVVVTHGGISTIDECVVSGVPVLVYCGFETDMGGTTARVVHHGIGIAGDRRDDTPVIREHIDRLLDEPFFETNLSRLRHRYAAYVENRVAEQVVESLLRSRGT
jgi:UDP:flavonoid glycosyltransferase YjiC (YdhE family)